MSARLPVRLDPLKECHHGKEYSGGIPLERMKRLTVMLQSSDSLAECNLRFSLQGKGCYRLEGKVRAMLKLECQRCLHTMLLDVDREFSLAFIQNEAQAALLDERWDPYLMGEDAVDVSSLIEDELILAIPDVPRHIEIDKCQLSAWQADELEEFELKPENPFTVLAHLKKH